MQACTSIDTCAVELEKTRCRKDRHAKNALRVRMAFKIWNTFTCKRRKGAPMRTITQVSDDIQHCLGFPPRPLGHGACRGTTRPTTPIPYKPRGRVYPFPTLSHGSVSTSCSPVKTHQAHSVPTEYMVSKLHFSKLSFCADRIATLSDS